MDTWNFYSFWFWRSLNYIAPFFSGVEKKALVIFKFPSVMQTDTDLTRPHLTPFPLAETFIWTPSPTFFFFPFGGPSIKVSVVRSIGQKGFCITGHAFIYLFGDADLSHTHIHAHLSHTGSHGSRAIDFFVSVLFSVVRRKNTQGGLY